MTQPTCINAECQAPLVHGDQFCGECGTQVQPLSAMVNTADSNGDGPFFSHEPPRPAGPLNNATRYLCAAAYLDHGFANKVIWHLMVTRRAVAPSINFDVGPVLRHCLRARRNILVRDIVLTGIMLLGLLISPPVAIAILALAVIFSAWPRMLRRVRSGFMGAVLAKLVITTGGIAVVGFIALVAVGIIAASFGGLLGMFGEALVLVVLRSLLALALLLGGAWITEYTFLRTTYATLARDLRLGAQPPGPASGSAENRIAIVEGAQWGNITLHGNYFPFIGAGRQSDTHWSIAIRLDPAPRPEEKVLGMPSSSNRTHVRLDPVELHSRIRDRLSGLNDPALPASERISALEVTDRLVGLGVLRGNSPLIDRSLNTPYSHASSQALQALIRHPQAGLRYYQQVTVNDEGPAVMSGDRKVLDGADMQVSISAFVYAAVEGHMLYLQYVLTALPPILARYRVIDYLPDPSSSLFGWKVRSQTRKLLLSSMGSAPAGLYTAFRLWRQERQSAKRYQLLPGGEIGATLSVRQEGTAEEFGTYTRELDVEKYNRIFARLLVDTVRDFLAEKHIDTSAFEGSAQTVINGDFMPGNRGQANFGGQGHTMGTPQAPGAADDRK